MFENMLIGMAIGDAFGAGLEFSDRHWIKKNVDFTCYINVRQSVGERLGFPPENPAYKDWNYTDDTEMTLGLIHALLSGKPFTTDLLIEYWEKEFRKAATDTAPGRAGHGSILKYFLGKASLESVRASQQAKFSPGNAPAMRAVPLGFLPMDIMHEYAIINADATHPHPKARAASILIARATEYMVLQKGDPKELINYCIPIAMEIDRETYGLLKTVEEITSPDKLELMDYSILCGRQPIPPPIFPVDVYGLPSDVYFTCGNILYILKHSKDTFDALKLSISMGGDVDTLAAVCCGIMGARHGIDSLPAFMREHVENPDYLKSVARAFEAYLA